ncbi:hypothetical protein KCP71_25430 [Salmonella enterica subsp. enterica]|nr:hypothetical protein KCP71_25430 [Salmonella enterica subsp. enterica]
MPNSKHRTNSIRWWDLNNPPLPMARRLSGPVGNRHIVRGRPDKAFTPPSGKPF